MFKDDLAVIRFNVQATSSTRDQNDLQGSTFKLLLASSGSSSSFKTLNIEQNVAPAAFLKP